MINNSRIFTSADTGTNMENAKDGPFQNEFSVDITFLWDIVHHVFEGTTVCVHVKLSFKVKNMRYMLFLRNKCFLDLKYVTHITAQLYLSLRRLSHDGEKRGFPFQKFVNLHKGQTFIAYGLREYIYSGFGDNPNVRMLMNDISNNAPNACMEAIPNIPEMKGDFEIAVRHLLHFIDIPPSLQKNATSKVASVTKSGGRRGCESGSDRWSDMPEESNVQSVMNATNNKYFCGSERGNVSTVDYNNMSKANHQDVYCLYDGWYGSTSPAAISGTSKYYDNFKCQVSALSKEVCVFITVEEPSSDEDGENNKKAKLGGGNLTHSYFTSDFDILINPTMKMRLWLVRPIWLWL